MNELILYQPDTQTDFRLEVRMEDDTVWLTQNQMAELFLATKQNISLHINNLFKENELEEEATVKYSLTVQKEGKRSVTRRVAFYNLDVIISVGYRVKSVRGTQFRIWANSILKDYLLKGYSVNNRLEKIEQKISEHDKQFEFFLKSNLPPQEGIFYDGQIFDAWDFVSNLIKSAKKSIVLIDNYVDYTTLNLLSKRNNSIKISIFTAKINAELEEDIKKYKKQYGEIEVSIFKKSHDRFLILDEKEVFHIGASLKDLGKRWFAFSKIKIHPKEILTKLAPQPQPQH
jgi:hypothetical protein